MAINIDVFCLFFSIFVLIAFHMTRIWREWDLVSIRLWFSEQLRPPTPAEAVAAAHHARLVSFVGITDAAYLIRTYPADKLALLQTADVAVDILYETQRRERAKTQQIFFGA
jgi:hypothetical protein